MFVVLFWLDLILPIYPCICPAERKNAQMLDRIVDNKDLLSKNAAAAAPSLSATTTIHCWWKQAVYFKFVLTILLQAWTNMNAKGKHTCRLCYYETVDTEYIFSENGIAFDYTGKINRFLYLSVSVYFPNLVFPTQFNSLLPNDKFVLNIRWHSMMICQKPFAGCAPNIWTHFIDSIKRCVPPTNQLYEIIW